jgi:hypothetical protein
MLDAVALKGGTVNEDPPFQTLLDFFGPPPINQQYNKANLNI